MISKFFDARNKFSDIDSLKKYLQKTQLTREDYYGLLRHAYENYRDKFIKMAEILRTYQKSVLQIKLKDNAVILEICKYGTAQEVQSLLKLDSLKVLDKKGQAMFYAIQNNQRKGDRNQALEIIKVLHSADPKLMNSYQYRSLVVQALLKQEFDIVQFLIEKGADLSYQSADRENLLHLLMKNYSKKNQKQIMNIRLLLIDRGVDEKKFNINSKRPYQLCPPEVEKRIGQEYKSQANKRARNEDNTRYKGKSDEGLEPYRNKNNEYRQKNESENIIKIQNKQDLYRKADSVVEKKNKQKQKQLAERERERMKQRMKDKEKKDKIIKKVFTPDQLKYFLNEEINYFIETIERENEQQKIFLNELINKITAKIKENFGATIKVFGSFATQLFLTQSDIDMVIIPNSSKQTSSSFKLLQEISNMLETMIDEVETVKFIKTASVPLVKIQCSKKYNSKKIDITYKDENHNGLDSVELILKYLGIYPQLRPLVFVLKKFIYSTNIYDPYSGGLSSYGLILMIVAYLQNQNRQRKSRGTQNQKIPTIAELLIGFLYFYGFKSNYIGKQICILDPENAKAQMEATELGKYMQQPIYLDAMDIQLVMYPNDWQPRAKLVIVDPLNPNNNIGRATHKIRQIKTAFEMAYVCIHTNKNCQSRKTCESYQRINNLNLKDTKCQNYQRPCCIIKRMLNSTKSFMAI